MDAARFTLTPRTDSAQVRDTRLSNLDARVESATLSPLEQLSPEEVRGQQQDYNGLLDISERLDGDAAGRLGRLDCILRPDPARRVREATQPNFFDNDKARDIKTRYRDLQNEAYRERANAVRTADRLKEYGPGPHKLSNGDEVTIERGKDGEVTVTTRSKDGGVKTVKYNENDPNKVHVERQGGGLLGSQFKTTLDMDGTKVSQSTDTPFQDRKVESYDVDAEGRPTQEIATYKHGPMGMLLPDKSSKTTVNDDGSTDTRVLMGYDSNGPIYYDHHEDQRHIEFPFPHPPRPWDLDPWRPNPGPITIDPWPAPIGIAPADKELAGGEN